MPIQAPVLVEAAVATSASARSAESAGAGRLELCSDLVEGGVTPSLGLLEAVRKRVAIPVHVLIRPRGGDFLYDDEELEVMLRDIALARNAGADGVVIGALDRAGDIDRESTARMAEAARPMAVTFHRAFDLTRDADAALDTLIALGVHRLLTSGQAADAGLGAPLIARLVERAGGRGIIMAGGGVNESNAARIVTATGVREIHVGASGVRPSPMEFRRDGVYMGKPYQPDEYARTETDPDRLRAILASLSA